MIKSKIIMDFDRYRRCGIEEAVMCEFKSIGQINEILLQAGQQQRRLLLTRLRAEKFNALMPELQPQLQFYQECDCALLGALELPTTAATIAIVSGGSSDANVCHEARLTLNYHGINCDLFQDVGVAALWRLQQILPELQNYDLLIAVAGMEAALPTVLAGLTDAPIIAIPTSVGYGVAAGGNVALLSCLASCAGGVMTMNIDNGYGAACAAIKIYRKINKHST
ncbi:nickel pincer cofactor biosynthesis protein LarB [Sodalis sp. dw_96]|uniref:nickel pincer cofactor biosynthesis protein LarB n=1 Tax=Sodalis sp. dw_96 TaxID=2719794 RepID=UPI001BD32DFB|nr:nickel pincer cofactor biosynthesis protein LarB [Sodalis sp. dw_96]